MSLILPPLSLYIHIPWCIKKCPYCDFNSHKSPDERPEKAYIAALLEDLACDLQTIQKRPLHSIFIGGGTPSLFSAEAFDELLTGIRQQLPWENDIEITLEANPGSMEQSRFTAYRQAGINRLSLGIQSFNAKHLQALGRIHDDQQAHRAIEAARIAGFDNINLDLMHGLPHQTREEGLADLATAMGYHPEHLSWYQLTIEPNTIFYKKRPPLPSDEEAYVLEEAGFDYLKQHPYQRYEISAFCRQGKIARHNVNYWLFGDYLGIGAGAHGKLTDLSRNQIIRTRKQRQPTDYFNRKSAFLVAKETITTPLLIFEFMLNATRLEQAVPHTLFTERTGLSLSFLMPLLRLATTQGLIALTDTYWQITPFGRRYTDDLQALFLP